MPKVSIIITTYNRASLIGRAIDSAKKAGDDVEVIVVDDASTDNTAEICNKICGIKYIKLKRNQRTAGARNIGITASTSPYIAFLDDDDWRLPGKIDLQIALLEEDPNCGLVYGQHLFENQKGLLLNDPAMPTIFPQGDVFWHLINRNFIGCLTAVFRKQCIYKIGLLDTSPAFWGIEDLDFWIRIAELYSLKAIKEPVAVYRKPETNSSQWSSNLIRQYSLIGKAYKNKWLKLPRAITENSIKLNELRNDFFSSISEIMMSDIVHSNVGIKEKMKKLYKVVEFYPPNVKRLVFFKTIVKNVLLNRK